LDNLLPNLVFKHSQNLKAWFRFTPHCSDCSNRRRVYKRPLFCTGCQLSVFVEVYITPLCFFWCHFLIPGDIQLHHNFDTAGVAAEGNALTLDEQLRCG